MNTPELTKAQMNQQRAQTARTIIQQFIANNQPCDAENAIADILSDIAHYCDEQRMSFSDELRRARDNYNAEKEIARGQQFDARLPVSTDERDLAIVALAKEEHEREGEIEIDDNARVSEGDDNGAYVQAWIWVSFEGTVLDKETPQL